MIFSSPLFLFLFLPLCILLYYCPLFKSTKSQNIILLIFSIIFYSYNSFKYLLVLLLSLFINYIVGLLIEKTNKKKLILSLGIAFNICLLLYYKIIGFMNSSYNDILPVVAPLGISFYTFQQLSYIIDIYQNINKPQTNILKYFLYITLFPQLIAGPIVRYNEINLELNNRKTDINNINLGLEQFIIGLFKKCVIADSLRLPAYKIFCESSSSILLSWYGAILLVLYIYYDFSAYSNMAIGLLKIFGFTKIKENFNYPYCATSINEFWKKWNISIGTWFNDYILFPICRSNLYLNTVKRLSKITNKKIALKICNYLALLIVWFLIGIWHGLGKNYILFSIYYYFFIIIEKEFKILKNKTIFNHIYTWIIIIIGTVIFFSYGPAGFSYLKSMFINKHIIDNRFILFITNYKILLLLSLICIFPITKTKIYQKNKEIILITLFLIALYYSITNINVPFIYFNF